MSETQGTANRIKNIIDISTGGNILYTQEKNLNLSIDTISNTLGVVETVHRNVHAGMHFTYIVDLMSTNSTDTLKLFLKGGGSTKLNRHITLNIAADKKGKVYFIEDILTSGGGGSTATAINNNRNSTKNSQHSIVVMPTTFTSSTGTLLWSALVGSNIDLIDICGFNTNRVEYVLASSKDYCVLYEPSADNTDVIFIAEWYENG